MRNEYNKQHRTQFRGTETGSIPMFCRHLYARSLMLIREKYELQYFALYGIKINTNRMKYNFAETMLRRILRTVAKVNKVRELLHDT